MDDNSDIILRHLNGSDQQNADFIDADASVGGSHLIILLSISVVLILFAGCYSGLTVGLLGVDDAQMQVLIAKEMTRRREKRMQARADKDGADEDEKESCQERRMLRSVRRMKRHLTHHHRLLCTLLLGNTICLETLPVVLDKALPDWLSVSIGIVAVLIFSEMLPMALLTGRRRLKYIIWLEGLVRVSHFVFAPVAVPMAWMLDHVVSAPHGKAALPDTNLEQEGEELCSEDSDGEAGAHSKACSVELRAMNDSGGDAIATNSSPSKATRRWEDSETPKQSKASLSNSDLAALIEINVSKGASRLPLAALDCEGRRVMHCMRALKDTFYVEVDQILDSKMLGHIRDSGYSRIPVLKRSDKRSAEDANQSNIEAYSGCSVVEGILLTKSLVGIDPDAGLRVRDMPYLRQSNEVLFITPSLRVRNLLLQFHQGTFAKLAFVVPDSHLGAVAGWSTTPLGIVSLDDVLKEFLQLREADEFNSPCHDTSSSPLSNDCTSVSPDLIGRRA
eukprot:TRINITY_DN38386_c0_g1_i1.p1 TRINITY_DN38386_c0_g1~~TRINITY_DN38386_c0_g1_i1.p1  ORF type:complete len:506 (+),score=80.79 TRINITY_DN38386_c0_g1_i1:75-1592(+)